MKYPGARSIQKECEELLKDAGTGDLDAFEYASEKLAKTPAKGGDDAVKKSYRKVEKRMRDPAAAMRYHILHHEFLRIIGAAPELKSQGKKISPFCNLT